jgi:3-(3-hydroxy-phenyl)propionate hydroxylase
MNIKNDGPAYDVVVIGCGLAGAAVANLLGQLKLRTLVLERDAEVYYSPRAIVLDDEVLRILQAMGFGERLGELTAPLENARYVNGAGRVLFDIPLTEQATASDHPFVSAFYQPELERVLRAKLPSYPCVTMQLGQEVVSITQDAEAVHLTVQDVASQRTSTLQARYVLGCDGARSFTRKALGIPLEDLHQDAAWLVVDAHANATDPFPMWNYQVCHPARPTTFVHGRGRHLRWEFKLRRGEIPEEVSRPERLRDLIQHAPTVGIDPDLITIQRSAIYTFHATIAQRWQQGRVLLLGDAAHQMPPFLGQGACAGFRDAINLAWKLQLVIEGRAPASLLATYEIERRPHVRVIIQRVITFGSIIQTTNWMQAWVRDRVLALQSLTGRREAPDEIVPPLTDGILAATPRGKSRPQSQGASRAPGYPFPQRPVTLPDGHIVLLDDALGPGFALVAYACNPADVLDPDLLARFTEFGGRLVQVAPSHPNSELDLAGCVRDHTDALQKWFAGHAMQVALVRPDRYLFGGGTAAQMPALMQQLLAMLLVDSRTAT